jgi:hypothetical protein
MVQERPKTPQTHRWGKHLNRSAPATKRASFGKAARPCHPNLEGTGNLLALPEGLRAPSALVLQALSVALLAGRGEADVDDVTVLHDIIPAF